MRIKSALLTGAATAAILFAIGPRHTFAQGTAVKDSYRKTEIVRQQLIKLGIQLDEAQIKLDLKTLDQIIADDYTEIGDGGKVESKEMVLSGLKSGEYVVSSAKNDELNIRVYSDSAVATGRWTAKQQYRGKDVSGQFRITTTWIKRGGRWQLVATHWSKIEGK